MEKQYCKLSIITINYGDIVSLIETIESIDRQTREPFENVVVASGLLKKEKEILQNEYSKFYRVFMFDLDNSIYNAMNIGQSHSSGNSVLFLNSGDIFYSNRSIEIINNTWKPKSCILFRTVQTDKKNSYIRPGSTKHLSLDLNWGHQGFITPISEEIIEFKENLLISADSKWMKDQLNRYPGIMSNEIISSFQLGGVSNTPTINSVVIHFKNSGLKKAVLEMLKYLLKISIGSENLHKLLAYKSGYDSLNRK